MIFGDTNISNDKKIKVKVPDNQQTDTYFAHGDSLETISTKQRDDCSKMSTFLGEGNLKESRGHIESCKYSSTRQLRSYGL